MLITEIKESAASVLNFRNAVLPRLSDSDDAGFYTTVFADLTQEFLPLGVDERESHNVFLQIGACSHWLRSHQTRITAAGSFAFPAGYLGNGFSRDGLPEFDWFILFYRNKTTASWMKCDKFFGKRKLVCRATLPTRTLQHQQAVINVLWSPGTPAQPKQKTKMYFAYRKFTDEWKQVAAGAL